MRSLAKKGNRIMIDIKITDDEPLRTSDVLVTGKLFRKREYEWL